MRGLPNVCGSRNFRGVFEAAKINYTLLDDVHFQAAGIELEDLHGYYIAEDRGAKVNVIPGLKGAALSDSVPQHGRRFGVLARRCGTSSEWHGRHG